MPTNHLPGRSHAPDSARKLAEGIFNICEVSNIADRETHIQNIERAIIDYRILEMDMTDNVIADSIELEKKTRRLIKDWKAFEGIY